MEDKSHSDALPGPQDPSSLLTDENEAVAGMDEDLEEGEFEENRIDAGDLVNGKHEDHSTTTFQHEGMTAPNISQPQPPSMPVPTAALHGGD